MTEPPQDGGQGQSGELPEGTASSDPGSPDYAGAPDDNPRRGAHRASGRPNPPPPPPAGAPYWPTPPDAPPGEKLKRPLADTLPLLLLQIGGALIGIIVLVALLYLVFHKSPKNESNTTAAGRTTSAHTSGPATPGATQTSAGTSAAGTSAPTATTTKGTPTATKTPAKPTSKPTTAKPTSKPTAKPTSKPTAKPTTAKPTTAAPPPVDVKAPLLVLNNSRIHGLAVTGATTFRNGGWTVVGTGNYGGRLPQTTVFYSPGLQAAAETLARQFPTVTAVEPRPAGIPGDALTVVLTRYFKP